MSLTFILLNTGRADFGDLSKLMHQGADAVDDFLDDLQKGVNEVVRTVDEWSQKFDDFLAEHGIDLDPNDSKTKDERLAIFQSNVEQIETANMEALKNGEAPPMEINHWAHLDLAEVPMGANEVLPDHGLRRLGEGAFSTPEKRRRATHQASIDANGHAAQEPPTNWSWKNYQKMPAALRSVKHQTCNNCWAHASIDALENRNWVKNGVSADLSINYVADCQYERTTGNFASSRSGCEGGWEWYPFIMARDQGIMTQSDYMSDQYTNPAAGPTRTTLLNKLFGDNTVDGSCRISTAEAPLKNPGAKTMSGTDAYFKVTSFQELKWEIFNNGACALGFGATFPAVFHAGHDVFTCDSGINHAVSVIGYGEENGKPYMLCKNSWGGGWGDSGYFKVLATDEYFGTGAKAGLIRIHCPNVKPNGMTTQCKDGEASKTGFAPVRYNPAMVDRQFSTVFSNSISPTGYTRAWLNSPQAWSPTTQYGSDYMIMDLTKEEYVAGIATQGRRDFDQWVTYYKVEVSNDKTHWKPIYTTGGEMIFKANTDRESYIQNWFGSPADGVAGFANYRYRYVKVTPLDNHGWPSMRVGVMLYWNRGCWCAGTHIPGGYVCSHQAGAVKAGTGYKPENTFFENNHDVSGGAVSGTPAPRGIVEPASAVGSTPSGLNESPAPAPEKDLWDTVGPIAVVVNILVFGCCAGFAAAFYLVRSRKSPVPAGGAFSATGERPGPTETKVEMSGLGRPKQFVSGDFSPRSPGKMPSIAM